MSYTNLREETEAAIAESGRTPEDVSWVGTRDTLLDTKSFWRAAARTVYDSGFGAQEVASDLVIVFRDGAWLERAEYDGSEWWEYRRKPRRPDGNPVQCGRLTVHERQVGWESLDGIWAEGKGFDR